MKDDSDVWVPVGTHGYPTSAVHVQSTEDRRYLLSKGPEGDVHLLIFASRVQSGLDIDHAYHVGRVGVAADTWRNVTMLRSHASCKSRAIGIASAGRSCACVSTSSSTGK
jgi:hypothetical protein